MATVLRKGKKRIITNDGTVQLDLSSNRVLMYDGTKYRFVAGAKPDENKKVQISNDDVNVLDLP